MTTPQNTQASTTESTSTTTEGKASDDCEDLLPGRAHGHVRHRQPHRREHVSQNAVTNWSLDLSDAMREDVILVFSMHWHPAPGPEGLLIACRRDGLCIVVADSEDVP